jgi:hypothetical protein
MAGFQPNLGSEEVSEATCVRRHCERLGAGYGVAVVLIILSTTVGNSNGVAVITNKSSIGGIFD